MTTPLRFVPGYGPAILAPATLIGIGQDLMTWEQRGPGACGRARCYRPQVDCEGYLTLEQVDWAAVLRAMHGPRVRGVGSVRSHMLHLLASSLPEEVAQAWASGFSTCVNRAQGILLRLWEYGPEPLRSEALALLGVGEQREAA